MMEPNNNMQNQSVTPNVEGQSDQSIQQEPAASTPSTANTSTPVVSPFQSITTQEDSSPESNIEPMMDSEEAPTLTDQPVVASAASEPKKSKTTLYLLLALGVVVIVVAGLFVFSIL